MVVSTLQAVTTLDGPKVVFVASVNTRAVLQSLLHLGLGAGATSEVSVTTNGRSASSEIVVRQRGETASGVIPSSTIAAGKAHVLVASGME
jgi:hypothetical protein